MAETLPRFSPALIDRFPEPFDHPDWLFETKYDGFRALAYVRAGTVELVSRTGHVDQQFAPLCTSLVQDLTGTDVVLDGEIVCLDETGRTQFDALMHRRGLSGFVAFDVLWHAGTDVRALPLWKRKQILRVLVPKRSEALLYADGVARSGTAVYGLACEHDLEGIVAKAPRVLAQDQEPALQPGRRAARTVRAAQARGVMRAAAVPIRTIGLTVTAKSSPCVSFPTPPIPPSLCARSSPCLLDRSGSSCRNHSGRRPGDAIHERRPKAHEVFLRGLCRLRRR